MKRKALAMVLFLIGLTAFHPTNSYAQEGLAGRTITGTAYFIDGRRPGRSLPFTLNIERTFDAARNQSAKFRAVIGRTR
jgi:hypothetical protein